MWGCKHDHGRAFPKAQMSRIPPRRVCSSPPPNRSTSKCWYMWESSAPKQPPHPSHWDVLDFPIRTTFAAPLLPRSRLHAWLFLRGGGRIPPILATFCLWHLCNTLPLEFPHALKIFCRPLFHFLPGGAVPSLLPFLGGS